jgi:hypothetical protein
VIAFIQGNNAVIRPQAHGLATEARANRTTNPERLPLALDSTRTAGGLRQTRQRLVNYADMLATAAGIPPLAAYQLPNADGGCPQWADAT